MLLIAVPPGPISGDEAQRAARDELRRVVYHQDDPSLLDRAGNWIGDKLSHLVDGSVSGSALLLVVLLLVAALVFAVVRAGRPRRVARVATGGDPLLATAGVDHRRLADELAAQGRRAEALREWLRAAIATIEERGVLEPRPGRTGREIARAAGAALPSASAQLQAATAAFDDVWFGERAATDADVAAGRAAAEAVRGARVVADAVAPSGFAVPR